MSLVTSFGFPHLGSPGGRATLAALACVAAVTHFPMAWAQISYVDPYWAPHPVTGLPPALFPAGWYGVGFGGAYGHVAPVPGVSYACRTHSPYAGVGGWHYGHVYGGMCYFPWLGAELGATRYDTLAGGAGWGWAPARPGAWDTLGGNGPAGDAAERNQGKAPDLDRVCRAEVNGALLTGAQRDGNCHVAFGGVEVIRGEYEVLARK